MKRRESVLFGRIELLAMEACVHYQMKNKELALSALQSAYDNASPNNIIMPFIELGKDMRTLTAAALSEQSCGIPKDWLESIKRKSSSYAKYQSRLIFESIENSEPENSIALSTRETELLSDLYYGVSRSEIADSKKISINTVNSIINALYKKLSANNIADVVRIAAERKLV
jgi:LuxR family maltose regulon positive regulatory protein